MSDKVWRVNAMRLYQDLEPFDVPIAIRSGQLAILPAADYDALTARCAALEQQLRIESRGTPKLQGEMLIDPKPINVEDLRLPADVERIAALERQVTTMREALHHCLCVMRYPDNGHHYCRSCSAGTNNNWQHDDYCVINNQCKEVDKARDKARRALGQEGGESNER